jgi:hypothetical protein
VLGIVGEREFAAEELHVQQGGEAERGGEVEADSGGGLRGAGLTARWPGRAGDGVGVVEVGVWRSGR